MTDALKTAEALSTALVTKDLARIEELYAEDVIVWHSNTRTEQDKPTTVAFLRGLFDSVAELRYSDIRRIRTDEGYVQQHIVHVTMKTGERFDPRPVCFVVKVIGGKVRRLDEYIENRSPARSD